MLLLQSAEVYQHAIDEYASSSSSDSPAQADSFLGFTAFCLVELGILHVRHDAVADAILAFDRALDLTTKELAQLPSPFSTAAAVDCCNDAKTDSASDNQLAQLPSPFTAASSNDAKTDSSNDSSSNNSSEDKKGEDANAGAACPMVDDPSSACASSARLTPLMRYRRWHCLQIETKKHYAMALKSSGDLQSAGVLFCELIRLFRAGQFQSRLLYSDVCFHLAEILNSQGRFAAAEPVIRECVAHRRKLFLGGGLQQQQIRAAAAAAAAASEDQQQQQGKDAAGAEAPRPIECATACAAELAKETLARHPPAPIRQVLTSSMLHLARASCSGGKATLAAAADAVASSAAAAGAEESEGECDGPCPAAAAASCHFSFGSGSANANATAGQAAGSADCAGAGVCAGAGEAAAEAEAEGDGVGLEAQARHARASAAAGAAEVAVTLCMLGATIAAPRIGKYDEAEACLLEAVGLLDTACAGGGSGVCDERSCMRAILDSIRAAKLAAHENADAAAAAQQQRDEDDDAGIGAQGGDGAQRGEGTEA